MPMLSFFVRIGGHWRGNGFSFSYLYPVQEYATITGTSDPLRTSSKKDFRFDCNRCLFHCVSTRDNSLYDSLYQMPHLFPFKSV